MMWEKWWHNQAVYQIYPRSFKDSNGDGIGDLNGIREKLWYLQKLGVELIWLCPVCKSPNHDNGYDISDYQDIMDEFGTMEDMCALISECKNYGISIMMDLVLNHSSNEHIWFMQSRSSKDNPYRDYYIWRDPADGKEPTDTRAFFGESVWEWDEKTGQYYLHTFSKEQPDLNWKNKKVREELYNMIRFWMDKGIEGFRLDAIESISKNDRYETDKESNRIHEYLHELNRNTFGCSSRMVTVGETGGATVETAKLFSAPQREELDMVFHFELMNIDGVRSGEWDEKTYTLKDLKQLFTKWQKELDGVAWNSLFWSNHDYPRAVSRFGNDSPKYREVSAKMLATMLHGMKGTPYIYQGEEIGMTNIKFSGVEDYRDIETKNFYESRKIQGWPKEKIMEYLYRNSRDNARTPMQWEDTENAGFTSGMPWISVNPNYHEVNAEKCLADKESIFYYYQKLIRLRKDKPALVYGTFRLVFEEHPQVFGYVREFGEQEICVICNFYETETVVENTDKIQQEKVLISNYGNMITEGKTLHLRPYEAMMVQLKGKAE